MADAYRPAREYEFSLTVRQIAAIVGGSAVVLAIAFGFGVGFGHRLATAPTASSRSSDLDHLDAHAVASPSPSAQPTLTYQQELTRNESGRAPPPPKREEPVETPKPSPSPVVAEKPSPSPTPVVALAEEPPKVVEAVAPKGERWTIQFGASKQRSEAEKIVAKLAAAGLDPFIVEADIAGKGLFYRVRVGQFGSKEAAERTRIQTQDRTRLTGVSMPMQ
jgi:cell division protein FtsN